MRLGRREGWPLWTGCAVLPPAKEKKGNTDGLRLCAMCTSLCDCGLGLSMRLLKASTCNSRTVSHLPMAYNNENGGLQNLRPGTMTGGGSERHVNRSIFIKSVEYSLKLSHRMTAMHRLNSYIVFILVSPLVLRHSCHL